MKYIHICQENLKFNIILYFTIIIAFILRFNFRFLYLEDWDSVQFALGLHNFSVVEHQPHPPGYPLYIILGRFFYIFTQNDVTALTLMSAILGSLSIIPLYLLAQKMFGKLVALGSAILMIIIPIHWKLSELAFTDIPGFFFLTVASYFIYLSKNSLKKLILSAFFSGIILGFRFNELPIIAGLLILTSFYQKKTKAYLLSLGALVLGVAIWLIPLVIITGFSQFTQSYSSLANYVIKHDVLLNQSLLSKIIIKTKLEQLSYLLTLSYTNILVLLSLLSLLWIIVKRILWKNYSIQFLLVWFGSYLFALFFVYNLENPRHVLPLLPPLIILVNIMLFSVFKNKYISISLSSFIFLFIFVQSWLQIIQLHKTIPPTISPVQYVQKNFSPKEAILITSFTYRQFQYYAPEFTNYYSDKITQLDIAENQTVIVDYLGLKDKIINPSQFELVDKRVFVGDKNIFSRVPEVNLYILKKKPYD